MHGSTPIFGPRSRSNTWSSPIILWYFEVLLETGQKCRAPILQLLFLVVFCLHLLSQNDCFFSFSQMFFSVPSGSFRFFIHLRLALPLDGNTLPWRKTCESLVNRFRRVELGVGLVRHRHLLPVRHGISMFFADKPSTSCLGALSGDL